MTSSLHYTDRILPAITGTHALTAWLQLAVTVRPALEGKTMPVPPGDVLYASQMPLAGEKVCLFAHFQAEEGLEQTTFDYLQALRTQHFHIVLVSTSVLSPEAVKKLASCCHTVMQRENIGLDFSSWKCATNLFPETLEAKELLLANDSVLYQGGMAAVFKVMDTVDCDFWGMTASRERRMHLQSYFVCLRQRTLRHPAFQTFWDKVAALRSKKLIIRRYESALTLRLLLSGLRGAAFIPPHWLPDEGKSNPTLEHALLLRRYFHLPFLKKQFLRENVNHQKAHTQNEDAHPPEAAPVDILLPTHNGERYLSVQLESLQSQYGVSANILARDDASTDATLGILRSFADKDPNMRVLHGERLGVVGNVSALLAESDLGKSSPYFALADQDDLWHPHKLRVLYDAMKALEARHGSDVPLLVCSDARCVDEQGQELHPSFLRLMGIPAHWGNNLRDVLVMSFALGCSCMGNAALRRMATPLPLKDDALFMHDWWLLLIASCFGAVHCIRQPLLDYRQHADNTLGARGSGSLLERLLRTRQNTKRTQQQAATFLDCFWEKLTPAQRTDIVNWANMPTTHIARLWRCWRQGFGKPGLRWFIT
jgi:hypothetical protein